jgi:hemolysin D
MSWKNRLKERLHLFLQTPLRERVRLLKEKLHASDWRHRKEAFLELLARYKAVFLFWWERRNQIKMPDLKADEAQFLPAALALQGQPVSPSARLVAKILIGLLLVLLCWSILGKMDIIVNGQGKIIAGGYTKTIAAVEVAKVTGLYVQEGQTVKAGQLLIELDSRASDADQNKAEGDRQLALLQMERSKALLEALKNNKTPSLAPIEGVDAAHYQHETAHLQDIWADYLGKRNRILSQIRRFGDALPLAIQRAKDYQALAKDRDVSVHSYLEKEQDRIELQGKLDDAKTQLASLTTETAKTAQDDLYQATRIWSGAVQESNKAFAHREQLRIVSPVDGVVQQLSIHTVGGVVPAAQPLMLIVPSVHTVELEAYVENKDIGFITEGQSAQVKIDAYDYTKYGALSAIVSHVSRDAVDFSGNGTGQLVGKESGSNKDGAPGSKGLMYAVKVSLQNPMMLVDGKNRPITPGMSASVEIKTGERRIISYALSPLITHAHEGLSER